MLLKFLCSWMFENILQPFLFSYWVGHEGKEM